MSARIARLIGVTAALVLASFGAAATAQAGVWTPVASGTSSPISAVDAQSATLQWYGTSTGGLYRKSGGAFVPAASGAPGPGFPISSVKFAPGGALGFATTSNGHLYRSINGGAAWTEITVGNKDWTSCFTPGAAAAAVPALHSVDWASDGTSATVVGGPTSTSLTPVVLRIASPGGIPVITNLNGPTATGCKAAGPGDPFTDVYVQPGNPNVMSYLSRFFGEIYTTTDALATPITQTGGLINDYTGVPRMAVDPANPNRIWAGNHNSTGDSLYFQYSEDGGATQNRMTIAGTSGTAPNLWDVGYAGGTVIGVGVGGQILVSVDGMVAYPQPADGALAANTWRAVSVYDGTHALIGGDGGALIESTAANTIPDVLPPAGTISGPETTTVGTPTVFSVNAVDNAGGSGIDPSSFSWSATGTTGATGNPAALTFTGTGYFTVTVSFRDLAGNVGTASTFVAVNAAGDSPPPPITPIVPPSNPVKPPSNTTNTTVSVPGGTITLGTPKKCVPAKSSFTARLSLKRRNAKGVIVTKIYRARFYIDNKLKKTDKKPPFTQKLTVKKLKAGAKHTLKAKAYIRMSNKKTRTKTIKSTFKVC